MALDDKAQREFEVAVYKTYLDDLGRLGGRHETLRAFYVTALGTLTTLIGLTSPTGPLSSEAKSFQILVGGMGLLLSLLWSAHMRSYSAYFKAKKEALRFLETDWGQVQPFTKEDQEIRKPGKIWKFEKKIWRVTYGDQVVALGFAAFYLYFLRSLNP